MGQFRILSGDVVVSYGGNGCDAEGDEWVVWWGEMGGDFFLKGSRSGDLIRPGE